VILTEQANFAAKDWGHVMIDLKKVLVPTDFSEHGRHALTYGIELAGKFGAELHLVHILQDLVAMVPEPGMAFPMPGDYLKDLRDASTRALAELAQSAVPEGVQVVHEVREGPPFLEVIRYAKENDIDLIVMGTHGRSGLTHALLGSVAEKVVRKAPCPVLTVRDPEHEFVKP